MSEILDISTILGFSVRLFISILLGMVIGFERQWTKHPAGILTNVIVCVGSYAYSAFSYIAMGDDSSLVDVTRVAAQVVCGIGFLGAGLIIRDGTNIRGLATAATIWTTAAVGVLCTLPNILFSIIVGIAVVVIHLILHPVSNYLEKARQYKKDDSKNTDCIYKISILCNEDNEIDIRSHLVKTIHEKEKVLLHNLESHSTNDGRTKIKAYISTAKKNDDAVESLLVHIGKDEGIVSVGWKLDN